MAIFVADLRSNSLTTTMLSSPSPLPQRSSPSAPPSASLLPAKPRPAPTTTSLTGFFSIEASYRRSLELPITDKLEALREENAKLHIVKNDFTKLLSKIPITVGTPQFMPPISTLPLSYISFLKKLRKLVAAQTGMRADKIHIQKCYNIYKDHITLKDYEIHDDMGLKLYYN
ncbi:uncharacterized protein LOC120270342 [Dioscorea cayenensis subsp. rotundata]|uniref:Uncharacterized protein LOC120270342 n=1 Tax=Dioscorea cayennensis subsp. rotundata TaxID=55577 RepID=A0AB40C0K6_DIOCR|nr:uncharacterized protein LOC120270342 [Dioscorea cayenensis subsp. rotundata]